MERHNGVEPDELGAFVYHQDAMRTINILEAERDELRAEVERLGKQITAGANTNQRLTIALDESNRRLAAVEKWQADHYSILGMGAGDKLTAILQQDNGKGEGGRVIMFEIEDGMCLKMVSGPWSEVGQEQVCHVVGAESPYQHTDAKSITVVLVNGLVGPMPWARVVKPSGRILMVNLSMMEEIELIGDSGKGEG